MQPCDSTYQVWPVRTVCIKLLARTFFFTKVIWLFLCSTEDAAACHVNDSVTGGVAFLSTDTGDCSLFEKVNRIC